MRRSVVSGLATLALVAFTATACDKSIDPDPITDPGPTEIAEPDFTGTLALNGAVTTHFDVTGAGAVNAIVKTIDPNTSSNSQSIGVALGTWNGTSCQVVLFNDNAGLNSGVAGFANAAGTLCARVYDPGLLPQPVNFVLAITHF